MSSLSTQLDANRRFHFELKGGSFNKDTFSVVRMTGIESISRPFQFTLTLVCDKKKVINFDEVLASSATFCIFSSDGTTTIPYYGVVSKFDQLHQAGDYSFYRALLMPRLSRLSQYEISEVYLDKTAPELVKGILNSVRLSDVDLKLTGKYRQRSYVCQFQETHLDFLSRSMEKEGMYYYFDHDDGKDKLVIVDAKIVQPAQIVNVNYRPIDELDTGLASNSVQGFICSQKPLSNKVVLQDYNYRKADVTLRVEEVISAQGIGDVMLYGENFRDLEEGRRYAKIRAEEIRCSSKVFYGEATAVGLRSGYFMKLAHHFRDDFNDQYLITEISHEGSQAGALLGGSEHSAMHSSGEYVPAHGASTIYRNTFRAIPASVQFRPERSTAKPRIVGTMNAMIDAEGSGQYAELDEYGQYKVQLPFDQTDKPANKSSARVRMVTPYSGSDHGMHFPLHKSAEVVLSFINGDPDQPIIMGAVPNSENKNVVDHHNSSQSMIQTGGGNLIQMEDKEHSQSIILSTPNNKTHIRLGATAGASASSGLNISTEGDSTKFVAGKQITNIVGDEEQRVLGNVFNFNGGAADSVSVGAVSETKLAGVLGINFGFSYTHNVGAWIKTQNSAAMVTSTNFGSVITSTNSGGALVTTNEMENITSTNTALATITTTNTASRISTINNGVINTVNDAVSITTTNISPSITTNSTGEELVEITEITGSITRTTTSPMITAITNGDMKTITNGIRMESVFGSEMRNIEGDSDEEGVLFMRKGETQVVNVVQNISSAESTVSNNEIIMFT
ncbi:MAG: Rhs element Vgr protein [Solimicrobium sp.]|jgi:type VI secretion system secreted protein VgrG|nr:Rhs element Vgr protein [Solimicrobium sp.]